MKPSKKHIIIDTDIGFDPDDFITLLLALYSDNLVIDLIVTNEENDGCRASLVKKILSITNNEHIVVVRGEESINSSFVMDIKKDNRIKSNYIEEINKIIQKNEITYYLGIGALTNLSNYMKSYDCRSIELVQMGGSEKKREHNFNLNYEAAKHVFSHNLKITLITSEITNNRKILITSSKPLYKLIKNSDSEVLKLLYNNIEKFNFPFFLHDPLALSYIIKDEILEFIPSNVLFLDSGFNEYEKKNQSNIKISIEAKYDKFMEFVISFFEYLK